MRQHLAPLFLLLSGVAATSACGGSVTSGGDGDGDAVGSGGTSGDGHAPAAGGGTGDAPVDSDPSELVCEPGAVRLCNRIVGGHDFCTGTSLCASEGSAWEACLCPTGVSGDGAESAGGAGGAGPSDGPTGASCPDVLACGGDVAGQWAVSSSCLLVSGTLDILAVGLGCSGADISGALQVSGRLTLSESGQLVDETTTVGSVALGLDQACLHISGTPTTCDQIGPSLESSGFSSVQCLDSPSGGCVCAARVNQSGAMGHISPSASTNGEYVMVGESLVLSGADPLTYSYCAQEESLVVTPMGTPTSATMNGTIVLELTGD